MTDGPILFVAAAALLLGCLLGPRFPRLWIALTLAGAAAFIAASAHILGGGEPWEWRGGFSVGGEQLHLRLDGLSALFLALLGVVGGAGAVYSRSYWSDAQYPRSAPRGRALWSALVVSMGGVLLASNGLHFLLAWEAFVLAAYFLIILDPDSAGARPAGWLYLAASHAGTLCLFGFFCGIASRTGSWDLGPMRDNAGLAPLFWLGLVGFGLKAGLFPLHVWLPSGHASAPSHVSAILSGVMINMGVYGLVRFTGWLPVPHEAGWVLIFGGAVSALAGMAFAVSQTDLKRLLAYCTVENVGIIGVGLGAALLGSEQGGTSWGGLALAGALLHVWSHGLSKALLFFGAGSVVHATGTRDMSRLGGLWKRMPKTAALFAFGSVAISGLPPLGGFVSEWMIYLGLLGAASSRSPAAWAAIPAAILLGISGALALAAFVKACSAVFLGASRGGTSDHAHESPDLMIGPMAALAALGAVIGLAPAPLWPSIARAAGAWRGPVGPMPWAVLALGLCNLVLAGLALVAAALLGRRVRDGGLKRAPTWSCGYAEPTARMQYTVGSFSGIISGWFSWALRPQGWSQRPRGLFPARAHRFERIPETVLEDAVAPAALGVLQLSTLVRRLQHGRLRFYILYIVAGLAGLGILTAMEARP